MNETPETPEQDAGELAPATSQSVSDRLGPSNQPNWQVTALAIIAGTCGFAGMHHGGGFQRRDRNGPKQHRKFPIPK